MTGEHARFLDLAAASVDFELRPAERESLERHLATCSSCARALGALRTDARTIQALPVRQLAGDRRPILLSDALRTRPDLHALRIVALAVVLALLAVGLVVVGSEMLRRADTPIVDPRPSTRVTGAPTPFVSLAPPLIGWRAAPPLAAARGGHTATLLPDGRVLVAGGGSPEMSRSTEIYEPSTGLWASAPDLSEVRSGHAALALPDGGVLVVGGFGEAGGLLFASEQFSGSAWSPGPVLVNARAEFAAAVAGRRVVVVGGFFADGNPRSEVEVWDIDGSLEFVEADGLSTPRIRHTATTLADGRVLVVGGVGPGADQPLDSAELFDPSVGSWRTVSPMAVPRYAHTATLLPDGRIVVVGGHGAAGAVLGTVEIFDPRSETWTGAASLTDARGAHAAVAVDGVNVLVVGGIGGADDAEPLASTEVFDLAAGSWSGGPPMRQARAYVVLVMLQDGSVMVIGGDTRRSAASADVELLPPLRGP